MKRMVKTNRIHKRNGFPHGFWVPNAFIGNIAVFTLLGFCDEFQVFIHIFNNGIVFVVFQRYDNDTTLAIVLFDLEDELTVQIIKFGRVFFKEVDVVFANK